MFQSPTSATSLAEPGPGGGLQLGQPVELVEVVGVVDLAAVGDVERPDADAAARRADRARLDPGRLAPRRLAVEADLDLLEPDPAEDRDAVPLVQAGDRGVVAQRLQAHQRQLVLARLGLLQREHVDVVPLQQRLDPVDPGAQGVDVPGGDPHPPQPSERRRHGVQRCGGPEAGASSRSSSSPSGASPSPSSAAPSPPPPGRTPTGSAATPVTRPASGSASSSPGSAPCWCWCRSWAWGAKLGREAWPPRRDGAGEFAGPADC